MLCLQVFGCWQKTGDSWVREKRTLLLTTEPTALASAYVHSSSGPEVLCGCRHIVYGVIGGEPVSLGNLNLL